MAPGVPVSVLTAEGPSLTGEVKVKKSNELEQAVRELSKEIKKEPLPPEYREQAERFQESLIGGDEDGE
jgi:hypothetical protein